MQLIDAIRKLDEADDKIICARRPWRADSDVCLVSDVLSKVPERVIRDGYEYFLEGAILREILDTPEAERCSEHEKVNLIIFYAENDAYPPWIYPK